MILMKEYSVAAIIEHSKGRVAYGKDINMVAVIDFLKRHAPEEYHEVGANPNDFFVEVLEDDYKHLKDRFIKQIIIITGHLNYS